MKVLFLSSWFPCRVAPNNGDFVERHALAVSEFVQTAVIHVSADVNIKGTFFEIQEIHKSSLYEIILYFKRSSIRIRPIASLLNNLYYAAGYLTGYWLLLKKVGRPDIIHANIIHPIARIARLLSRYTRIPFIISEHWTLLLTDEGGRLPSETSLRKSVKKAFALVPVTNNLKDALIRHGFNARYFVVPNVVDTKLFRPGIPPAKLRFLHVSSMKEEHKNISGLLRTIKRFAGVHNDFEFFFAGPVQDHQKQLADELGLGKGTIHFIGEIPHIRVAEIMQQSHIFVMFSRIENLPCAILEALSCGLPVISSNVGGISEWINESNGMLVPSEDEDALLRAMMYVSDHFENYQPNDLHRFAEENFSPQVIAGNFLDIYNQALNS
jgi:glycosyltransferase involved in cell wall biosynthesis